jgi:hypothetical protein
MSRRESLAARAGLPDEDALRGLALQPVNLAFDPASPGTWGS